VLPPGDCMTDLLSAVDGVNMSHSAVVHRYKIHFVSALTQPISPVRYRPNIQNSSVFIIPGVHITTRCLLGLHRLNNLLTSTRLFGEYSSKAGSSLASINYHITCLLRASYSTTIRPRVVSWKISGKIPRKFSDNL